MVDKRGMCRCVKGKCYTYDGKQTAAICSVDPCLTRAPFVKCGNKRSDGGGDGFWGAAPDPGLGASIELSSALPKVVRRMIRGNLIAT